MQAAAAKIYNFFLQFHIIVGGGIELALLFPTIFLLIGACRKIRCLMLPFLVLFGIAQLFIMASILACVFYLPSPAKPLAVAVTAVEAFVVFPWWFATIHLFAAYDKNHYKGPYLVSYPPSQTQICQPVAQNLSNFSHPSLTNSHTRSMLI